MLVTPSSPSFLFSFVCMLVFYCRVILVLLFAVSVVDIMISFPDLRLLNCYLLSKVIIILLSFVVAIWLIAFLFEVGY